MKTKTNENGFHVIEILIAIVVIAIIGLVGYRVISHSRSKTAAGNTTFASLKPVSQNSINTKVDLQKAVQTLNTIQQQNGQTKSDVSQLSQKAAN